MRPHNWLSVKSSLVLATMFESNQTCCMTNSPAIQGMCRQFVHRLVAWSGNNQFSCACLRCPSLAFSWVVNSRTLPLYGIWLWIVSADVTALTEKVLSSLARWSCMWTPFVASDCRNHYCSCSQYAMSLQYRQSRLSSKVKSLIWCDVITIKLRVSAQHHLWAENKSPTDSAALLHALELLRRVFLQKHMMR